MSGGYDNTNRGSIWGNKRKTTDAHPDFTGTLNVEGREYFFDAWKRKPGAAENAPSLTFKIKLKDQQPSPEQFKESAQRNFPADLQDKVPF